MTEEKVPVPYDENEIARRRKRSIQSSMGRTVNAIYHIARSNTWDWFITLTFNPEIVDSFDYQACVKKLSVWLNNSRKLCPGIGYIIVPELHKSGRFHFHGLFRDCNALGFVPAGKRTHKGDPIYNVGKYKFGWTTATAIADQQRVTKYIAKYINKDLCQVAFGKKRYWASRNLQSAETVEVILDPDKLKRLKSQLINKSTFVKQVDCAEVRTMYFELPAEVSDDAAL